MSFRDANEKYGKVFLIASSLVVGMVILLLFKFYGYDETWKLWRVPVESPQFSDFRLIPGSAESYREGIEPTQRNPGDPYKRIFNYPAFWRLFFYTNITQDDTVWMVLIMLVLFFVSVFLFPQNITIVQSLVMLLVIFSPASMLLYERGNVDLIVFFLCVLIVLSTEHYSPFVTTTLLMFATIVKLFPFFGVTVFFKESKSKFIGLFLGCFGMLVTYMYATSKSVRASWDLTMRGKQISYGADVLFLRYDLYFSNLFGVSSTSLLLKYGPIVLAFILIMSTGIFGISRHAFPASSSERNLAAFRMGASIYVGTFLLGNNWDYRLAFLTLVVPQLLQWSRSSDRCYSLFSSVIMVLVFITCWHFIVWFDPSLANVKEPLFIIDELANWMLVAGFSFLLFASMPDWAKEQFKFLFPKNKTAQIA